ncbi:unannotated protein [freshwater metagenome]|uniref:Unannotated protein n=1 Tax=freshwater metagenome TaxID=449393 RepID=A0A6J6V6S6_9ZZZZ
MCIDDLGVGIAVHAQHVEHVALVGCEAGKWPHAAGDACACGVRVTSHHRGKCTGPSAAAVGVVWHAECHQERTNVCVAQAQLTEEVAVLANLFCWVVGVAYKNFLCGEHHFDGVTVCVYIEDVVIAKELQQVDGCKVACRVVDVHVFAAWVGTVDAARCMRGVPLVDGGVELQAWVGAFPRGGGNLAPQVAGTNAANWCTILNGLVRPVAIFLDCVHELVGDAHRVVGVLVLDGERVFAIEIHVEAGVAQCTCLLLFAGLAPDELFNVWVIHVQDDHLRCTTCLATGLDGAC